MPAKYPLLVKTPGVFRWQLLPARIWQIPVLAGLVSALLLGCGQTGTPQPPSLQLPDPVTDLAIARVANRVTLRWTMPRRTTDKLPIKSFRPVQVCRRVGDGPCTIVGTVSYGPEKPASFEDSLPAALAEGGPQLLLYSVDVLSPYDRSAGASNIVYTAAGAAPPALMNAHGEITARGVVLTWRPEPLSGGNNKVEIDRTLLSTPTPAKAESQAGAPSRTRTPSDAPVGVLPGRSAPVKEQKLIVRLPPGADPGKALDPDAAFDQRYSYRLSRLTTVEVAGKSIDIAGPASAEIVVETKDVFPPAAPSGLAAVAAPEEGAIDLSWAPDLEADLAGYAVYRKEGSGGAVRISSASQLLETPAFRDTTARPGQEYVYSVTAIDRDGNQSPHSDEVSETLPPK